MDLVFDPALALFAGLRVVPKRSYLAACSSRLDHRANLRLMQAWFEQLDQRRFPCGSSFDLDFHSVPAHSESEPLEKHYVSARGRSRKGVLVSWPATPNSACRATPAPLSPRPNGPARSRGLWTSGSSKTGSRPAELVFGSPRC